MAHDLFISHAAEDKPVADAVCSKLESRGVRCWIAPRDILPGEEWPSAISRAIAGTRIFVLVFSEHANASHHVQREVATAFEHGRTVIPFRVTATDPSGNMEYWLSSVHWLDALTPPIEARCEQLADRVACLLGREPDTSAASLPLQEALPPQHGKSHAAIRVAAGVVAFLLLGGAGFLFFLRSGDAPVTAVPTPVPAAPPEALPVPTELPVETASRTPSSDLLLGEEREALRFRISHFVNRYLESGEHPDPAYEASFFAEQTDYFDQGMLSREAIQLDIERYRGRWPERQYRLVEIHTIRHLAPGRYTVDVSYVYRVSNGPRSLSGTGMSTLTLSENQDSFLVAGVAELTLPEAETSP